MKTQPSKPAAVLGAATAAATIGAGALAVQPAIEAEILDVAQVGLASLKEMDDTVLANSLRNVRAITLAEILAVAHGN